MSLFLSTFGHAAASRTETPGRVNLLGEWVDFSGGLVLPMAIDKHVVVEAGPNGLREDRIVSGQFESIASFPLDAPAADHWADYARGALQAARARSAISGGYDIAMVSNIPHGAGLSSSAAVIVGTLRAIMPEPRTPHALTEIATLARQIENEFIGVPCGIMDQMAVAHAKSREVLALDTETLSFEVVPLPVDWQIVVLHSGVRRELADGRYKERRDECLAAAEALNVELLCHSALVDADRLDPPLMQRARHVISEDIRAREAKTALMSHDIASFAASMRDGQCSIAEDFEITTPAVDRLVADAVSLGALAARQTGGGFGGCIVVLLKGQDIDAWWSALAERHPEASFVTQL